MSLLTALGLPPRKTQAAAAGAAPAAKGPSPSPSLKDQLKQGLSKQLDDAKAGAREKLLTAIGTVKGVALQATEAADTAMWAAAEVRDGADALQKRAHDFVAGPEGSTRRKVVDTLFVAPPAPQQPSMNPITTLARMSDDAKKAGWVDDRGNASVSTPLSAKLDKAARWVEEKVGGTPADPEALSTMDKAELGAAVGTQVALAAVGVEEVKLLMNALGAAGAMRAVVESYRKNGDACFKDPALWSGVIGLGLQLAGIKTTGAAGKLAAAAQKYGWMLAAVPPLTQMCIDALDPKIVDEKERQARVKRNMAAALNIVKDVLLHKMSQASGKEPPPGTPPREAPAAAAAGDSGKAAPGTAPQVAPARQAASAPETPPVAAAGKGKGQTVLDTPAQAPPLQAPAGTGDGASAKPPAKSQKPLKGWMTEEPPKAANDNAEMPPAQDKVVPLPKRRQQEVPLAKAAGAERMPTTAGKPPAGDKPGGNPLEVVASGAGDGGGKQPGASRAGPAEPMTFAEINRLPGMQDFIGRLEKANISMEKLGVTQRKLVEMASADPQGVAARLDELLVKRLETQRELRDDQKLPRAQQVEEGTPTTTKPNPKKPSAKTEGGNFAHRHYEVLDKLIGGPAPSAETLQPGMRPEFRIPDPNRPPSEWMRVDRVDWEGGVVVEIGPAHRRGEKFTEAKNYAAMLDKTHPRPEGKRWMPQVKTYDQQAVLAFLRKIGYLE